MTYLCGCVSLLASPGIAFETEAFTIVFNALLKNFEHFSSSHTVKGAEMVLNELHRERTKCLRMMFESSSKEARRFAVQFAVDRLHREDSLDSFTSHDSSYGERGGDPAASAMSNHDAREHLDSLLVAFLNTAVDVHGVADFKRDRLFSKTALLDNIKSFVSHDSNPLSGGRGAVRFPKCTCPLYLRRFCRTSPTKPGGHSPTGCSRISMCQCQCQQARQQFQNLLTLPLLL